MNGIIHIDAGEGTPLYLQLERSIRAAIATGTIKPGDQLPTVRQLAVELKINANTVAKVYLELERMGVVATRRGVGTFVLESPPTASREEHKNRLRQAADRFIADMASLGYSLDDLLDHLQQRRNSGE